MKGQVLFSWINKKNNSKCRLLNFLHELSNPVFFFWEKVRKYFKMSSAEDFT